MTNIGRDIEPNLKKCQPLCSRLLKSIPNTFPAFGRLRVPRSARTLSVPTRLKKKKNGLYEYAKAKKICIWLSSKAVRAPL